MYDDVYAGKNVLLTGHTGFKGSWLAHYLLRLGANVIGFALEPPTEPNLFELMRLEERMTHIHGDICDRELMKQTVQQYRPDIVLHLAAQPIVLQAYEEPYETFQTNVMGTASVLDALRTVDWRCAVIMITTDKVYLNREWPYPYREDDPLGGGDPYSGSKAAMEIVIDSYRRSYFRTGPVRLASARAGNVIGGGDWAAHRIVPDAIRALQAGEELCLRNPKAIRPWQHVLEPLSGYLWLGARLYRDDDSYLADAWNFGPDTLDNRTVADLADAIIELWEGARWRDISRPDQRHEASILKLSVDKASSQLGWRPVWNFADTVKHTVGWYHRAQTVQNDPAAIRQLCDDDINAFEAVLTKLRLR